MGGAGTFGEFADWTEGEVALAVDVPPGDEDLDPVDPEDLRGGEHFLLGLARGLSEVDLGLSDSLGEMLLFLLLAAAAVLFPLLLFIMSDSILLQALVSMANGLIFESICKKGETYK